MKNLTLKKLAAVLLAAVLALSVFAGCGGAASSAGSAAGASSAADAQPITATFKITDGDGNLTEIVLQCAEGDILADALQAAGIISAEEADAGYVTAVNGITADWNAAQAWRGLVDANGEMTAVGIGDIKLADGDVYGFVYNIG